ncbi:hypothetical protein BWGOE12_57580 [Bacillus mycoides]|nr:hypothetical protein BWGOE12_57580 [Bacillus mycoides]
MEFRKKGFENDFFKVVAYILLSIEILKVILAGLARFVKKHSLTLPPLKGPAD